MPSLFTRDVQVVVLASGSRGNCTYIGDAFCGVLIDCGVSARQVLKRMGQVGLQDAPIDAVLVTHEHSDHVAGAAVLSRRLLKERGSRVPFFMTEGTRRHLNPKVVPDGVEVVEPGQAFQVGHFSVDPFSVPHDTECPVAYRVGIEGQWFGVVTDLGHSTRLVAEKLRSLTTAVLEFNHDTELLLDGPYSWPLKQRIRSAHGHLSNDQSSELLADGLGPELRHLVLAHLSEENNRPEKALASANGALQKLDMVGSIRVEIARQDRPTPPLATQVHGF